MVRPSYRANEDFTAFIFDPSQEGMADPEDLRGGAVLKEAEVMTQGLRLGPVGGRIVAEVIIGLLQSDPDSFLSRRNWTPEIPQRNGRTGDFRMVDFLTFAGVDPASRGE